METAINTNGTAKPMDQLREIVGKAEELLGALGHSGDATVMQLRQRAQSTIKDAKDKLGSMQTQARDLADKAVNGTDDYIRASPWIAVGVAAAVGTLIAAVVARRV